MPIDTEKAAERLRRRQAKARGAHAELVVGMRLRHWGYACVEQVATPSRMVRGRFCRTSTVSGDWKAVDPETGRAVLVEVKCRPDVLSLTDLAAHQRTALDDHAAARAISIIAWVRGSDMYLLRWPVAGLEPGKPLKPEAASQLAMTRR